MIEIILGVITAWYLFGKSNLEWFIDLWHSDDISDKVGIFVLMSAWGLIGGVIGMLMSTGIDYLLPTKSVEIDSVNLTSLRDNISTTGSFFLGSGSINGELEYYYYVDLGNNTYHSESMLAKYATVLEDDPKQPYLVTYDSALEKNWWNWFALNPEQGMESYEFHIPKGSITGGYTLNLGK